MASIPSVVHRILSGEAEPAFHLSSLDCGVGKTTTLRYTLKAVMQGGPILAPFRDLGTVICLSRLAEIEKMIGALGLASEDYAVLVNDQAQDTTGTALVDLGRGKEEINRAPVLFTSHAMMEQRLVDKDWQDAADFYFRDRPCKLRIWDEAVFVRNGITLDIQALYAVVGALPRGAPEVAQVRAFVQEIEAAKDGALVTVPDVAETLPLQAVWAAQNNERDRKRTANTLQDFWIMSGKPVLVRHDRGTPNLVTYTTRLPQDLKPLLVLDASARVRETYRQQDAKDQDIVWLPAPPKRCDRVKIAFEEGPAGRSGLGRNWDRRLAQAVEIIRRHPDHKALVLHHKEAPQKGIRDMEAAVRAALKQGGGLSGTGPALPHKPEFLHWGVHSATNDYTDCNLIITASIFREPEPATEARGRAAADRPVDQAYNADELAAIRHGEMLHDLLQGLSRGSLRNLEGDQAQECLIYLMADRNCAQRIKADLPRLFPSCQIAEGWHLVSDADRGQATWSEEGLAILDGLEKLPENVASLTYAEIRERVPEVARPLNKVGRVLKQIEPRLRFIGLRHVEGRPGVPGRVERIPDWQPPWDPNSPY